MFNKYKVTMTLMKKKMTRKKTIMKRITIMMRPPHMLNPCRSASERVDPGLRSHHAQNAPSLQPTPPLATGR